MHVARHRCGQRSRAAQASRARPWVCDAGRRGQARRAQQGCRRTPHGEALSLRAKGNGAAAGLSPLGSLLLAAFAANVRGGTSYCLAQDYAHASPRDVGTSASAATAARLGPNSAGLIARHPCSLACQADMRASAVCRRRLCPHARCVRSWLCPSVHTDVPLVGDAQGVHDERAPRAGQGCRTREVPAVPGGQLTTLPARVCVLAVLCAPLFVI